jgi:hypothetical protein
MLPRVIQPVSWRVPAQYADASMESSGIPHITDPVDYRARLAEVPERWRIGRSRVASGTVEDLTFERNVPRTELYRKVYSKFCR